MDGALSRGTAIVEAHGGKVLQYAGDNLLAAFGARARAEDDAERAVRCGLALLDLGKALGAEVRASHGPRRLRRSRRHPHWRRAARRRRRRGRHASTACREHRRAHGADRPAGRPAHQPRHLRARARRVRCRAAATAFASRASTQPVRTYLVLRARPRAFRVATRGIEGVETRMIGRERRAAGAASCLRCVMAPGRRLAARMVVADAGVGKSRLLYEFDNWADARPERFFIFQARATPQTRRPTLFGLLHDLFAWRCQILDERQHGDAQRKLEDALVPLFAGDQGDTRPRPMRTCWASSSASTTATARTCQAHPRRRAADPQPRLSTPPRRRCGASARSAGLPLVIQLDDLHWADDALARLHRPLGAGRRDVPLLLLVLTRPALFERRTLTRPLRRHPHRPCTARPACQPRCWPTSC